MTPTAVTTFERETVYWSENASTKLREIPITFHDVEEYYATFYTTLVEEVRSDLKDAYDGSIGKTVQIPTCLNLSLNLYSTRSRTSHV